MSAPAGLGEEPSEDGVDVGCLGRSDQCAEPASCRECQLDAGDAVRLTGAHKLTLVADEEGAEVLISTGALR